MTSAQFGMRIVATRPSAATAALVAEPDAVRGFAADEDLPRAADVGRDHRRLLAREDGRIGPRVGRGMFAAFGAVNGSGVACGIRRKWLG